MLCGVSILRELMCGIFAVAGITTDQDRVLKALATLKKRGPDDLGVLSFPHCTLTQTRLAIVDLSPGGHQPMQDARAPHAITFNGEIYGYKKLRADLEKKGHLFATESDTETILKAYAEYGEQCVNYLDGMFAFALWDEEKQQLFLARDRFGKKPLYYATGSAGELVVASEIKALIAYGTKPIIDPRGIDAYLTLMYLPPWMTFFSNVHTLPPAHTAVFKTGTLTTTRYWKLEEKAPLSISYDEAKEETRRLFDTAVEKRMIADVEIGAFLSGGIDSTLVTAYAAKYSATPIKTFSIGYGDYINELPFAAEAAAAIGTDHRTREVTTALTSILEDVSRYLDEPQADSANLAQSVLSSFTSEHVKVALSGDGGDELFMGYGSYFAYWNRPKIVTLKNALLSNPLREHLRSITVFPERMRNSLMRQTVLGRQSYIHRDVTALGTTDTHAINLFDLTTTLPGMFLTKVDRTSMMHSLEVRCPFLDTALAEFAYQLPEEYKMSHHTGKLILKDLLAEIMPRTFVDRKKQGFGAPVRKWLREDTMRTYVTKRFESNQSPLYEHLNRATVQDFVRTTLAGNDQKSYYRLWVLLCLELWLQTHHN